jgi:hypothetical protein
VALTCASLMIGRIATRARRPLLWGWERFHFNFARKRGRGNGSGDLEDAVAILGRELILIHTFGQFDQPLEGTVTDFPVEIIGFFCLAGTRPLPCWGYAVVAKQAIIRVARQRMCANPRPLLRFISLILRKTCPSSIRSEFCRLAHCLQSCGVKTVALQSHSNRRTGSGSRPGRTAT